MALSEEHKARMAAGRRLALEARRKAQAASRERKLEMPVDVPPLPKAAIEEIKEIVKVPDRWLNPKHRSADIPVMKKAADPLLGINATDCCIDCHPGNCVISGKPYCAHPNKCGLAPVDKMNPQTMERYNRARKVLLHAQVERQS